MDYMKTTAVTTKTTTVTIKLSGADTERAELITALADMTRTYRDTVGRAVAGRIGLYVNAVQVLERAGYRFDESDNV